MRRSLAVLTTCSLLLAPAIARADGASPKHLAFGTYLGGEYFDYAQGMAMDLQGSAYLVGTTESAGYPTTLGAAQPLWGGLRPDPRVLAPLPNRRQDAFATKLDRSGKVVYSTYLGGSSTDAGTAIAVDAAGNAYVGGVTYAVDFPATAGAYQTTLSGTNLDGFVTKLGPDGSIVWSTYLGVGAGPGQPSWAADDFVMTIAVDEAGRPVVAGYTGSSIFPTTPNAAQPEFAGGSSDGFVAVLAVDGKSLAYSSFVGGADSELVSEVALGTVAPPEDGPAPVAATGTVVLAGQTRSEDFPTTEGAYDRTFEGTHEPSIVSEGADAFVLSLPLAGGPPSYGTFLGGGEGKDAGGGWYALPDEQVHGLAVGSDGRVYLSGYTGAHDFPATAGAFQTKLQDGASTALFEGGDGYVAALTADGGTLSYATHLGAESTDFVSDLQVDAAGRAHVTGFTSSRKFPLSADAYQPRRSNEGRRDTYNELVCAGPGGPVIGQLLGPGYCEEMGLYLLGDPQDAFLTVLDAAGAAVGYSTYVGGWGDDIPMGMGLGTDGSVTIAGYTGSSDFPARRATQPVNAGATDATLVRFSPVTPPPCELEIGPICVG